MRISTAQTFDSGIEALTRRQSELSAAQDQLTTGKRVSRASDDPAAAARAERALAAIGHADANQRAVDASRIAMTQTETALADSGTLLQRARELLVAAGNASYSDAERQGIAGELKQIRSELLSVANQSDGAGTYLFGGQGATQKPFIDAPGGVQYAATAGQVVTESSTLLPLTSDGKAAWLSARTGNGLFVTSAAPGVANATIDVGRVTDPSALTGADYSIEFSAGAGATTYAVLKNGLPTAVTAAAYVSGQAIDIDGMSVSVSGTPATGNSFQITPSTPSLSVFDVLDRTVADLQTPARSGSQIAQRNAFNLRDIDSVMTGLISARATAGAVLNTIDSQKDRLDSQKLSAQIERSNAEDVDLVHAISEFQAKQTGYDAALKSYASVQRLSLFQYLNG